MSRARQALRTGDLEQMQAAELTCADLERDGLVLNGQYTSREAAKAAVRAAASAKAKHAGTRGATLRGTKADAKWARYEDMYRTRAEGKDRKGKLAARRLVKGLMVEEGFVDPYSGEFPHAKTIEKHLPT